MYNVKLTYFSLKGNQRGEGEYKTSQKEMFDIVEELQAMRKGLPGITESWGSFILVKPEHLRYTHLMLPDNDLLKDEEAKGRK